MAKRKYAMTEKKVQAYLKEGRGQGSGLDYKPWLYIHDFPSLGRVHRICGLTIGRIHHLMSDGEARYFTQCDWRDDVIDIREQFPLDRDLTYRLAKKAGIKHPVTTDGTPSVFTTDFLLVVGHGSERKLVVRTFKQTSDLTNRRVMEKFEVERRYFKEQGVDWGIVTEEELDHVLIRNVEAVRGFADLTGFRECRPGLYQDALTMILGLVEEESDVSLREACRTIDDVLDACNGTALIAAKHLIAHKRLLADMHDPQLIEKRPLSSFSVKPELEQ